MAKDYMKRLFNLGDVARRDYNPFDHILQTPSPSVNFTFGNSHGLPLGYSAIMWGPPGGGKSLLCNNMAGQVHSDYEDGIVVKFDSELREESQMTDRSVALYGIDRDRYICYEVNKASDIFDRVERDLGALCQDGAPIKLVIIDSITGIQGRRDENAKSVDVQQIGDHAATIYAGVKRILPTQRKYGFSVILTAHARAEMDPNEAKRAAIKMQAAFGAKHYAEYFVQVTRNRNKDSKVDLLDNPLLNPDMGDVRADSDGEITAVKIKVVMSKSFCGPEGRTGMFTWDFKNGIINTHEEIFMLGVNRGIVSKPSPAQYMYRDKKWIGKANFLEALKGDLEMQRAILAELKDQDMRGVLKEVEATEAE